MTIETKPVTAENLLAALLAWDAWERAALAAANLSRTAKSTAEIDAARYAAENAHAEALSYQPPRPPLLRETAEQRVIRLSLSAARERAEKMVRTVRRAPAAQIDAHAKTFSEAGDSHEIACPRCGAMFGSLEERTWERDEINTSCKQCGVDVTIARSRSVYHIFYRAVVAARPEQG